MNENIVKVINEINTQGTAYKKFSNEWNVIQQLIDIVTYQPDSAEIVYQDLQINEMKLPKLVSRVVSKRLNNPQTVMEEICKFYAIPCPDTLPPETWRNAEPAKPEPQIMSSEPINLLDLL